MTRFSINICMLVAIFLLATTWQNQVLAVPESGSAPNSDEIDAEQETKSKPKEDERNVTRKSFSKKQKKAACKKYEGQYISYYADVFKVENCKRRAIHNHKTVYKILQEENQISEVKGDVIAMLKPGTPLDKEKLSAVGRKCKELEGKYVTFSNVDVFFVEKCKKRLFPDWTSYLRHRKTRGDSKGEILGLNWKEFSRLKAGKEVASVIDAEFAKLLYGTPGVDVIPIDEACEGVEGKYVIYYSRFYKIEKCRKREINSHSILDKQLAGNLKKLKKLTSEQWLSLPDGKPIKMKYHRKEKEQD